MIKLIDAKINKIKHLSTIISVKFQDTPISKEQYSFLKDQLNKYKLYLNNEYTIKSETRYHKPSKLMIIELNITIPYQLIPEDPEKSTETLMDPIILFETFYEAQNEIYKRNIKK